MNERNIEYVSGGGRMPEERILEKKRANRIDHFLRRIKTKKVKELAEQMLEDMMQGVRRKL